MVLADVDLSEHVLPEPQCESTWHQQRCDNPATIIAQGCMDKHPVLMCESCFNRGVDLIKTVIKYWQRLNKRVMICGDCHRPILCLDTHLTVKRL